jgi:hypothetical protein
MDMIERVARALRMDATGVADQWADMSEPSRNVWRKGARAAIAAMRDCTPEMLDAGSAEHLNRLAGTGARRCSTTSSSASGWRW